jgi:hypothetical protein
MQHILVSCVFAREVWHVILHRSRLGGVAPQQDTSQFSNCWCAKLKQVLKEVNKGLNSQYTHHFKGMGDLEASITMCLLENVTICSGCVAGCR